MTTTNGISLAPPLEPTEADKSLSKKSPYPGPSEDPSSQWYYERRFRSRVCMEAFLELCAKARGEDHTCAFGEWRMGGFNIAIFVEFDDGVEWVIKAPQWVEVGDIRRLHAEVATLLFLSKIGIKLAPQVYDYSLSSDNPARTPFLIMSKMAGVSLGAALHRGMPKNGMYKTIEGLAELRKSLQAHACSQIGSPYISEYANPDKKTCSTDRLISVWCPHLDPALYDAYNGRDSLAYYYSQHKLSLYAHPPHGEPEERAAKEIAHCYLGLLLPSYIIPTATSFYLAHTDLSRSNVLVNPDDGTLSGIIDWEFANVLPPQAAEQYPLFLAHKSDFVDFFDDMFEDPAIELENLKAHYAAQFDDAETIEFNNRIDAIIKFEHLLHFADERTIENIDEVMNELRMANGLNSERPPLPRLIGEPVGLSDPNGTQITKGQNDNDGAEHAGQGSSMAPKCNPTSINPDPSENICHRANKTNHTANGDTFSTSSKLTNSSLQSKKTTQTTPVGPLQVRDACVQTESLGKFSKGSDLLPTFESTSASNVAEKGVPEVSERVTRG